MSLIFFVPKSTLSDIVASGMHTNMGFFFLFYTFHSYSFSFLGPTLATTNISNSPCGKIWKFFLGPTEMRFFSIISPKGRVTKGILFLLYSAETMYYLVVLLVVLGEGGLRQLDG